jgi:hypothetical protein
VIKSLQVKNTSTYEAQSISSNKLTQTLQPTKMDEPIEGLSREIEILEADMRTKLADLRTQRDQLRMAMHLDYQGRRNANAEAALGELFQKVFPAATNTMTEIVPEQDVKVTIFLMHSVSSKIYATLVGMTEGHLSVKNESHLFYASDQYVVVTFPYDKLESVMNGLSLSSEIDVSEDKQHSLGRC